MSHGLMRHIAACRNTRLPGNRLRLDLGAAPVGWVTRERGRTIAKASAEAEISETSIRLPDARSFEAMAATLATQGVVRDRHERFAVRATLDGPELARIDRGALPFLGVMSEGVHLNGLVQLQDGPALWVAERAANKTLDPGKLDHITAGGIPAGLSPAETLAKEAGEEAAIPAKLLAFAIPVGHICYAMERPEGLRRDRLHCYDLWLPEDVVPRPTDGEVAAFSLWPLSRALEVLSETDRFKFNVALVLIDLFLRLCVIDPVSAEGRSLRAALSQCRCFPP